MKFVLSPVKKPNCNYMVKQTKRAILLVLMDDGAQVSYWVPKSQATLRKRDVIRIIDKKPVVVDQVYEVVINGLVVEQKRTGKTDGMLLK